MDTDPNSNIKTTSTAWDVTVAESGAETTDTETPEQLERREIAKEWSEVMTGAEQFDEMIAKGVEGISVETVTVGGMKVKQYNLSGAHYSFLAHGIKFSKEGNIGKGVDNRELAAELMDDFGAWDKHRKGEVNDNISCTYMTPSQNVGKIWGMSTRRAGGRSVVLGFSTISPDDVRSTDKGDRGTTMRIQKGHGSNEARSSSLDTPRFIEDSAGIAAYNEVVIPRYPDEQARRPDFIVIENGELSKDDERALEYFSAGRAPDKEMFIVNFDVEHSTYGSQFIAQANDVLSDIDDDIGAKDATSVLDKVGKLMRRKEFWPDGDISDIDRDTIDQLIENVEVSYIKELKDAADGLNDDAGYEDVRKPLLKIRDAFNGLSGAAMEALGIDGNMPAANESRRYVLSKIADLTIRRLQRDTSRLSIDKSDYGHRFYGLFGLIDNSQFKHYREDNPGSSKKVVTVDVLGDGVRDYYDTKEDYYQLLVKKALEIAELKDALDERKKEIEQYRERLKEVKKYDPASIYHQDERWREAYHYDSGELLGTAEYVRNYARQLGLSEIVLVAGVGDVADEERVAVDMASWNDVLIDANQELLIGVDKETDTKLLSMKEQDVSHVWAIDQLMYKLAEAKRRDGGKIGGGRVIIYGAIPSNLGIILKDGKLFDRAVVLQPSRSVQRSKYVEYYQGERDVPSSMVGWYRYDNEERQESEDAVVKYAVSKQQSTPTELIIEGKSKIDELAGRIAASLLKAA